MNPSIDTLFAFAKSLQGVALSTLDRRRPFTVRVTGTRMEFTPGSSTNPRVESRDRIEAVLRRFAQSGSKASGHYADVTFNASYVLALVHRWQTDQLA